MDKLVHSYRSERRRLSFPLFEISMELPADHSEGSKLSEATRNLSWYSVLHGILFFKPCHKNSANQNTGKPFYVRWYYFQLSHHAPRLFRIDCAGQCIFHGLVMLFNAILLYTMEYPLVTCIFSVYALALMLVCTSRKYK